MLRYREEMPVQDIADVMGIPEGTVKTYLYRARKELASQLSGKGWDSGAEGVETRRQDVP